MDLYRERILDHYKNPRNFGKLEKADSKIKLSNPLCGDEVEVFVKFDKDKVKRITFEGKGCVISLASASILTEELKGKKKEEILSLDKDFMLKLLNIALSPNRLKCALLPLEAIQKAVRSFENKENAR